MSRSHILVVLVAISIPLLLITACSKPTPVTTTTPDLELTTEMSVASPMPSETVASPTPTPTPVPLAVVVNGEPITLDEFLAEVNRYQAVITGTILASDTNTTVMNELIDQTLLAQGAEKSGFIVDEAFLQTRIDALTDQVGGAQALEGWITAHGYTDVNFRQALKRSIGAAWMRDQIASTVPETADQVHVFQILLPTSTEAGEVHESLQSGVDFFELATTYSPLTKGDLGWFPRGYLGEPGIDEAVFALQPGQYSDVIETETGFHILYLAERDSSHTLQADARITLQVEAIKLWLDEQRNQGDIQILYP